MADEKEVASTEETTDEVAETTDTEEDNSSAEGEHTETEGGDKFRKAFEDQKKRAEKAEAELKKLKGGTETNPAPTTKGPDLSALEQRTIRAELAANGIKERTEQEFVIGAAKRLGIEPAEAANDPIVSAKLDKMREEKATKDATPSPTKRSGGTTTNVTSLAEKALKTGELPTDPELRKKVRDEMRRISK